MDPIDSSSDEEFNENDETQVQPGTEDFSNFTSNYQKLKETYKTRPYLTKYEKTKVLSERTQQLCNGADSFLKNPESYPCVDEIALEELRQGKIPFIIRRPVSNHYEYWKLEDLEIV
jgi:DNA-directed RNA polymerase subunit K/omega